MFSFEGAFRSTPTVSLGGRSKKLSTSSVSGVVEKARNERNKREELRKQERSSVILQSSIRSYFARKNIKEQLREKFEKEKENLIKSDIFKAVKWICFFYEDGLDTDARRLVWVCQRLLRKANKRSDWVSSFLLTRTLALCCKCLISGNLQQTAIPLRMIEVFTHPNFWYDGSNEWENIAEQLSFWRRLMNNGFFSTLLNIFCTKVPVDLEPDDRVRLSNPHQILANSLIDMIRKPLTFAGRSRYTSSISDLYKSDVEQVSDLIINRFLCDVASKVLSFPIYIYLILSLCNDGDFPRSLVMLQIASQARRQPLSYPGLKQIKPNVDLFVFLATAYKDDGDENLIECLAWLMPVLHLNPHQDGDSDSEMEVDDEDDEHLSLNVRAIDKRIIGFLSSSTVVRLTSDNYNIPALSSIIYYLMVHLRVTLHGHRLLYSLAMKSDFLNKLWSSILNMKAEDERTDLSHSCINSFIHGRNMKDETRTDFVARTTSFACLYSHNLLSMHDADFYRADLKSRHSNPFSLHEILEMVVLLRDMCLSLLLRLFPEHRPVSYDVREVEQRLSSGSIWSVFSLLRSSSLLEEAVLFKICSRLLGQLYIRNTRRPLSDDPRLWLSPLVIERDRTKHLSNNWRRRSHNDNVAAHMADPSDEDLSMTISEARQLTTLVCLPFVTPFETRVSILTSMLDKDRHQRETSREVLMEEAGIIDGPPSSRMIKNVKVRRDYIYEDSFNDLSPNNIPDLRAILRVTFINAAGAEEAGYGQGVTREFFQQLIRTAFDPSRGLFQSINDSELCPNPYADRIIEDPHRHYHFLGRLLGKVLYEGMQVELRFASLFLCKLLRPKSADVDINHLQLLDPDYYKNLMYLRSYDGNVRDLDLNFTVVDDRFGETKVTELVPGGQHLSVNNYNRFRYIHLLADYKLNVQMRGACDAFRSGLASVLPLEWLRMFDHRELQTLISGAEVAIDVEDMRKNAAYSGGYQDDHATVKIFWSIMSTLSEEEKRKFLFFVTSCSRPPLLGFKEMHPPFCIHNGGPPDRLPTSSTCLNLFRLPRYEDMEVMREKVLYCIGSQSGFELS